MRVHQAVTCPFFLSQSEYDENRHRGHHYEKMVEAAVRRWARENEYKLEVYREYEIKLGTLEAHVDLLIYYADDDYYEFVEIKNTNTAKFWHFAQVSMYKSMLYRYFNKDVFANLFYVKYKLWIGDSVIPSPYIYEFERREQRLTYVYVQFDSGQEYIDYFSKIDKSPVFRPGPWCSYCASNCSFSGRKA